MRRRKKSLRSGSISVMPVTAPDEIEEDQRPREAVTVATSPQAGRLTNL